MNPETATRDRTDAVGLDRRPGLLLVVAVLAIYGGLALTIDFPKAAIGIQSDEATYYMMGYSLAKDGDLEYRREDLVRVWREFSSGPSGLFLKRGRDIVEGGIDASSAVRLDAHAAGSRPSRGTTTGNRSRIRSSRRRSSACSARTGSSFSTRCCSRSSSGAATCSCTRAHAPRPRRRWPARS